MNTSTTAKIQYTYASGSANTIRATWMVYPSGRVLSYSYLATGGQSDRLSRVASYIDDDGNQRRPPSEERERTSESIAQEETDSNVDVNRIRYGGHLSRSVGSSVLLVGNHRPRVLSK